MIKTNKLRQKIILIVFSCLFFTGFGIFIAPGLIPSRSIYENMLYRKLNNRHLKLGNTYNEWKSVLGPPSAGCSHIETGVFCWPDKGIIAVANIYYHGQEKKIPDVGKWKITNIIIPQTKSLYIYQDRVEDTPVIFTNLISLNEKEMNPLKGGLVKRLYFTMEENNTVLPVFDLRKSVMKVHYKDKKVEYYEIKISSQFEYES